MQLYDRGIRRRLAPMLGGDQRRLELAYSLMFTLPGTPVIRYGDELGMGDDLSLPERNCARTVMQWSGEPNGGFTKKAKPHTPVIDEGQRPFTLRAQEADPPANSVTVTSKVTRLSVAQVPSSAATGDRVRFRGRGFTDLTKPIYMHYVFGGKSKKTIGLGVPTGDCGLFSVRRKQFPFKKSPQRGVWTIQFDQSVKYDPKASPRVPLTIKVQRKIKPKRAQAH